MGIVTFLLTDIEGSTRAAERYGTGWGVALARHHALLGTAVGDAGGQVVSTAGDSVFAVFTDPASAVAAAVSGQRALAGEEWPNDDPLRARMGIHTGRGELAGPDYAGLDVHRAARIAAAGHGGQVLLSGATCALVEAALPDGVTLQDHGEHHLKDMSAPEHLFALRIRGLQDEFPPLRSLRRGVGSLPRPATSFVGRGREIQEVADLLADARLVTLTGPGGIGKTRLALEVAGRVGERMASGAAMVPLASLRDARLVGPTVAAALEFREAPDRSLEDQLIEWLAAAEVALVLDNLEQLPEAAPFVGRVAAAGPAVRVIATSRGPLRVAGEVEYRMVPLEVPPREDLDELGRSDAVRLFVDRARQAEPGFELTPDNAAAVRDICASLDGLPLAIELAAARLRLLGPLELRERLHDRLHLLTGGPADGPQRQRTLRATIEWSHDLLDEPARVLFRRLGVFRGGWTLEAAEEICACGDLLDALDALTSHGLVVRDSRAQQQRFRMLETIREFARERLDGDDDAAAMRDAHLEWFRDRTLSGALDLEQEHDNLRAALDWADGAGRVEDALRMCVALLRFWQQGDHVREAETRLSGLLDAPAPIDDRLRARATAALATLRYWLRRYEEAEAGYRAALERYRDAGDAAGMDEVTADLGWVAAARGEWDEAIRIFGGVAESCRTRGDPAEVGPALQQLGMALHRGGHQAAARERLEAAETVLRSVGDTFVLAGALYDLGRTLHCQGDLEAARGRLTESLSLFVASVDGSGAVFVLDALSRLDVDDGHPERAVRLAARADSLRRRLAAHAPEAIVGRWDVRAAVRGQLPEWAVEAAWAGGTTAPSTDLTELMREATDDIDEPADG